MVRIFSLLAVLAILFCLSGRSWAQTEYQPTVPAVSNGESPTGDHTADSAKKQADDSPALKVRPDQKDRTIRLGPGDRLQISVYGAPDLTTEARVNAAGDITMPLVGRVHVAGLSTDEAQQARVNQAGLEAAMRRLKKDRRVVVDSGPRTGRRLRLADPKPEGDEEW